MNCKGVSFKPANWFYHSSDTIYQETGIKKHSLNSIIKKFSKLGILEVEVKGMPKVKHFKVNYPRIMDLLSQIYQLAENGKLSADFSKLLYDFFQPLANSYQQKNNKKNNQTETLKETKDSDSDWETLRQIFFEFLSSLHYEKSVPEKSLQVEENLLYATCKEYGPDEVLTYLKKYFAEKHTGGSVQDFFKADKIDSRKLTYIEKQRAIDRQHLDTFIVSLSETFNERREMAGNKNRRYSKPQIPINEASKKLIADALKVKTELEIRHAFLVYCDQVLEGKLKPQKFLPYFFSRQYGDYGVIDQCLDYFNLNYSISKN